MYYLPWQLTMTQHDSWNHQQAVPRMELNRVGGGEIRPPWPLAHIPETLSQVSHWKQSVVFFQVRWTFLFVKSTPSNTNAWLLFPWRNEKWTRTHKSFKSPTLCRINKKTSAMWAFECFICQNSLLLAQDTMVIRTTGKAGILAKQNRTLKWKWLKFLFVLNA